MPIIEFPSFFFGAFRTILLSYLRNNNLRPYFSLEIINFILASTDQPGSMRGESSSTSKNEYFKPILERTLKDEKLRGRHVTTAVAFGPEIRNSNGKSRRRLAASAYSDGGLTLWNVPPSRFGDEIADVTNRPSSTAHHENNERSYHVSGHNGAIHDICFARETDVTSMDKAILASAGADGTVRLWSPASKEDESIAINAHKKDVNCLDFGSESSSLLLSCSNDKTAKIWHLPSQKFACSFNGHMNWVRVAKFSPDSRLVATGSDDKTVKIWDYCHYSSSKDPCISTFNSYSLGVTALDFHPDRTILASASSDIKFWDLRSNSLIQHYPSSIVSGSVSTIAFHPSGNFLLSTNRNGKATIWDVREGRFLADFDMSHQRSESKGCVGARFSSCGKSLITGGTQRSAKLWSTKNLNLTFDFVQGTSSFTSHSAVFNEEQHPTESKSGSQQDVINTRRHMRKADESSSLARSLSTIFSNSANAPGINLNKGDFSSSYESYVRNSKNNLDSPVSKQSLGGESVQSNMILLKLDELSSKVEQLSTRLALQEITIGKLAARIDQVDNTPDSR